MMHSVISVYAEYNWLMFGLGYFII